MYNVNPFQTQVQASSFKVNLTISTLCLLGIMMLTKLAVLRCKVLRNGVHYEWITGLAAFCGWIN